MAGKLWGNALGGWRLQGRDGRGRFSSSGRKAKKAFKAQKRRNAQSHRARTRGSVKARVGEYGREAPRRVKNVATGAAMYGIGESISSPALKHAGKAKITYGLKSTAGRVSATRKMSKGLQRSQNRKARAQYHDAIGSTKFKRGARNLAIGGAVIGSAVLAKKKGFVYGERDFDYGFVSVGRDAQYAGGLMSAGYGKMGPGELRLSGSIGRKRKTINPTPGIQKVKRARAAANKRTSKYGVVI